MHFGYLFLLLLFFVFPAQSTILEKGLFDSDRPNARLLLSTEEIRAKLGSHFGFRFQPSPELTTTERLEVVVHHPPMAPRESTATGWFQYLQPGKPNTVIWKFEHQKELLPGTWTIYLLRKNQAMYALRFEVVASDAFTPI